MPKVEVTHLKSIALFADMEEQALVRLSENVSNEDYPAGELIIGEGDEGDCLYYILSGKVEVFLQEEQDKERVSLSELVTGDYFGEMSLLTGQPRSASVKAINDTRLLRINKTDFDRLILENRDLTLSMTHLLADRLKNANLQRLETEKYYHHKFTPSGSLADVPVLELLTFCEQNTLTGKLEIKSAGQTADVFFRKGVLRDIEYKDLAEYEALDAIIRWTEGEFSIHPSTLEVGATTDPAKKKSADVAEPSVGEGGMIENLVNNLFSELTGVVGSRKLREIVTRSIEETAEHFVLVSEYAIDWDASPVFRIALSGTEWNEKRTLTAAVFLEKVIRGCQAISVGMGYLDVRGLAGSGHDTLQRINFFDYMEHAAEFSPVA
jgi:CRP-like cAMP-binding protein